VRVDDVAGNIRLTGSTGAEKLDLAAAIRLAKGNGEWADVDAAQTLRRRDGSVDDATAAAVAAAAAPASSAASATAATAGSWWSGALFGRGAGGVGEG